MNKKIFVLFVTVLLLILPACNFPSKITPEMPPEPILVVTPQKTETSVFDPILTPSPTAPPTQPVPTQNLPTPGPIPNLQYKPLESNLPVTISAIDMLDDQIGWAQWDGPDFGLSGFLLRTVDGGQTWQEVTPPSRYPYGSRFFAIDDKHAWVAPSMMAPGKEVEAGYVWRTSDGGQTWQPSAPLVLQLQGEPALLENFLPHSIFFLDEQNGWIVISVGHYMNQDVLVIYATQDGGQTWNIRADKFSMGEGEGQDGGVGMPCRVTGIAFLDTQHGFFAGDCIAVSVDDGWSILETKDGGQTWHRLALPEPAGIPQVLKQAENSPQRICAPTGVERTPAGILVQHTCLLPQGDGNLKNFFFQSLSSDAGQNWTGWSGETASFADWKTGYSLEAVQQDGTRILSTTADGGSTWREVRQVSWPNARLDYTPGGTGYVLASQWNPSIQNFDYALVKSSDGGVVWDLVEGVTK